MSKILKLTNRLSFGNNLRNFSINERIRKWYDFYEDFIGVKEVRKTQEAVLKVNKSLIIITFK